MWVTLKWIDFFAYKTKQSIHKTVGKLSTKQWSHWLCRKAYSCWLNCFMLLNIHKAEFQVPWERCFTPENPQKTGEKALETKDKGIKLRKRQREARVKWECKNERTSRVWKQLLKRLMKNIFHICYLYTHNIYVPVFSVWVWSRAHWRHPEKSQKLQSDKENDLLIPNKHCP